MENNVDFATIGASAPDTYANTTLQGSSDLDYQPISPRPAPPVPSAAASSDTQDQAARLRALLSSHLSEGGAGSSQATGADRLEALIDMLYTMTAPPEPAPVTPPAVQRPAETNRTQAPVPVETPPAPTPPAAPVAAKERVPVVSEENALAAPPASETYAFTPPQPARELLPAVLMTQEAASIPASAPVVMPASVAAPISEATPAAHFAAPEIADTRPEEPQAERADAQSTPLAETLPAASEAKAEPIMTGESAAAPEPFTTQEPTAFTDNPPAKTAEATSPVAEESVSPTPPHAAVEFLATPETSLLGAIPGESVIAAGTITFNLATDKSTASLQIPMQSNLSLITFEQRLDEIILKIHLSL